MADARAAWQGNQGGPGSTKVQVMKAITHDQIIDFILANPRALRRDIGEAFGYSETSISVILHSDAFQARYLKRQGELLNPFVVAKLEDRMNALAAASAEIVHQRLQDNKLDHKFALDVLDRSTKALGMGVPKPPTLNQQFVVHLPGPAASSEAWTSKFAPETETIVLPDMSNQPSEAE